MLITGVKGQDRREQNEQIWTKITQMNQYLLK